MYYKKDNMVGDVRNGTTKRQPRCKVMNTSRVKVK